MKQKISMSLLCAALAFGFLGASEAPQEGGDEDRIPIGTRGMTRAEYVMMQEKRAEVADENPELQKEVELRQSNLPKGRSELTARSTAKIYDITHQGAIHFPNVITGNVLEIEDGSLWAICSSHLYKTTNWITTDKLIITQNTIWFSSYDHCVVNLTTGDTIHVNLAEGPFRNGAHTRWIIGIDYINRNLVLDDGSVWYVSSMDSSIMYNWAIDDTIIIGVNDGWYSSKNHILINVRKINYACAHCLN